MVEIGEAEKGALESFEIAKRWCADRGSDWHVLTEAGRGGTAPVYAISSPTGPLALKIYDAPFSSGEEGDIQSARVQMQVELGDHDCPYLVKVYSGGRFEDRLFVLMSLAPGGELEKRLKQVPRDKIRTIIDQVARAAQFLADKGLCHRDIKAANIFVSDDFDQATLLDVSVLRDINDPLGVGTDHGDRLPMIATARYSPPEYLFRLLDPGPEAWHALNIYQIGAVLHDLICREPMFEDQYKVARDNRYRFAWAVATLVPQIDADDVDRDLIDLARRALEKDWKRRSSLQIDDFFGDVPSRKANALHMLGFRDEAPAPLPLKKIDTKSFFSLAHDVEDLFARDLFQKNVRTVHDVRTFVSPPGAMVSFEWEREDDLASTSTAYSFGASLVPCEVEGDWMVMLEANLEASADGRISKVTGSGPILPIGPNASQECVAVLHNLLGELAMRITRADESNG